ncbi:hypothetical protein DFS34DRAFT_283713 [Phlyctochytrium arcticum]|nr:hypothetical protein DFS34DRAFT_283713 [Phlyctochytrium arcticum]
MQGSCPLRITCPQYKLVLDQVAQKLADALTQESRTRSRTLKAWPLFCPLPSNLAQRQVCELLILQRIGDLAPLGQGEHVMTMHLGKDPSMEAYDWLVPFYDISLGGIGPRTHVQSIVNLIQTVQDLMPIKARHHNMLTSLFLGPFRDVYDFLRLGGDSLGANGLLEANMTTNSGKEEHGESQASVGTVSEHPEISSVSFSKK